MNVGHRTSQLHNTNATSDCIWLGSQAKTCKFYVTCCSFFSMMKPTYEFSWNKWTVKRRMNITKKRVGEWELWIKKWKKSKQRDNNETTVSSHTAFSLQCHKTWEIWMHARFIMLQHLFYSVFKPGFNIHSSNLRQKNMYAPTPTRHSLFSYAYFTRLHSFLLIINKSNR